MHSIINEIKKSLYLPLFILACIGVVCVCCFSEGYISANGNVLSGCDFSYDHGDQISLGNLFEDSLLEIVKRESKQEVA